MNKLHDYKYHYFYKITNLINNHFYYGVHNTNNLNDKYMGSGYLLKKAYKKYGQENFKKEIVKFFNSYEDAFLYEELIVNENLVNDKNCYNICNGGINPKILSKEIQEKRNQTLKNINHQQGEKNSQYGTCWIHKNNEQKKIKKEELNTFIEQDWKKGRNNKVKKHIGKIKFIKNLNTNEIKAIFLNEIFDNNWIVIKLKDAKLRTTLSRKLLNISGKGEKNSQYGTCWIHKNNEQKKIKKDELNTFIEQGWKKGPLKYRWINNKIKNTRVLENNLHEYLNNGWILGKIKK